jgi:hypothetical protein
MQLCVSLKWASRPRPQVWPSQREYFEARRYAKVYKDISFHHLEPCRVGLSCETFASSQRKNTLLTLLVMRMRSSSMNYFVPFRGYCRSQWPSGLGHELFSPATTLRSWVRIQLRHGCLCVFCVRFFCFYIVSSETASRPNKRLMRTYHCISLFMSYTKSAN